MKTIIITILLIILTFFMTRWLYSINIYSDLDRENNKAEWRINTNLTEIRNKLYRFELSEVRNRTDYLINFEYKK